MASLIITNQGEVINEYALSKEKNTVGRKQTNDIVLDDPTISGVHAIFIHTHNTIVEDMSSTNGIKFNDALISKRELCHGDIIEIGLHKFKFIDEEAQNFASTVIIQRPVQPSPAAILDPAAVSKFSSFSKHTAIPDSSAVSKSAPSFAPSDFNKPTPISKPVAKVNTEKTEVKAEIVIVEGNGKGKSVALNKPYTKLGSSSQLVVIAKRRGSYYLMPMNDGTKENIPKHNGDDIGAKSILLSDGDVIEIAATKLKFRIKK